MAILSIDSIQTRMQSANFSYLPNTISSRFIQNTVVRIKFWNQWAWSITPINQFKSARSQSGRWYSCVSGTNNQTSDFTIFQRLWKGLLSTLQKMCKSTNVLLSWLIKCSFKQCEVDEMLEGFMLRQWRIWMNRIRTGVVYWPKKTHTVSGFKYEKFERPFPGMCLY